MNRLKNCRVYLSSGMDRVPDGGVGWREAVTPLLQKLGMVVLNPCDKPIIGSIESPESRQIRIEAKKRGDYEFVAKEMSNIAHADLRMVDICDCVLLYLDTSVHYCGTYHETFVAAQQHKPIIVVCKNGVQDICCWLFGVLNHKLFFGSFDEMFEYLEHIDKDEEIDTLNKWVFIDYNKIFGK